jgi:hypothetical protein
LKLSSLRSVAQLSSHLPVLFRISRSLAEVGGGRSERSLLSMKTVSSASAPTLTASA